MALHEDLAIIDLTVIHVHLAAAINLVFLEVIKRPDHLGATKSLVLPMVRNDRVLLVAKRKLDHLGATKSLVLPMVRSDQVLLVAKRKLDHLGATKSLGAVLVLLGMKIKASNPEKLSRIRAVAKVDNNLFYRLYDL